jgi:diketogulonate reductase-like aldo/keto reductase
MEIPSIGFGTFRLKGNDAYQMVLRALQNGYRHIDTAKLYGNEQDVGRAIKDSGVKREEIFITTKIWKDDLKNENRMIKSVKNSLRKLGVDYLDLVLLHTYPDEIEKKILSNPVQINLMNLINPMNLQAQKNPMIQLSNKLIITWRVMESILDNKIPELENKVKHIGVSNYKIKHLEKLLKFCKHKPYVNQIEVSPYLVREDLVKYCQKNDIKVVAHTSLIKGEKFTDDKLVNLSKKYEISMPLLLLGWALSKNYVVLPRTSQFEHLTHNYKCLEMTLSKEIIEELDRFNENYATHPQYIKD